MRANLTHDSDGYRITSTRKVGGTRPTRDRCIALTDCVCYDADGNVIRTIPRTATLNRTARKSTRTPVESTVQPTRYDSRKDIILAATLGTIHSEV